MMRGGRLGRCIWNEVFNGDVAESGEFPFFGIYVRDHSGFE